ncbi:hypothetical protein ABBQ32_004551 [Trebouxia sp. C0010 RCD-2024]
MQELWLQHNQIAGLSALRPLTTLPSLAALFLSPNPLCDDFKADYRVAVVSTLPSLQALDGQAVSEADRAGAADYSTRQTAQPAANAASEDSNSSPSATSQRGKPAVVMPQPGLPGSPGRGRPTPKGKSSKHRKSREVAVAQAAHGQHSSNVLQPGEAVGAGFGQVTEQLPKFDIDKHGNRLDKPLDPYGTTIKGISTKLDARPVETVYQTFYGNTSQHQAVIVRSDGSATAQYPSEGVAVSVDPEQTGVRRGGMRVLATYRSTGLAAVMFEADGTGSVQYPNGNLWMSFTAETGKGALYSHSGKVTRAWTSESEEPIELLLDDHLGFCYNHQQPVVYFACEGQMHCFKQGHNPAEHIWEGPSVSPTPAFLQRLMDDNRKASHTLVSTEPESIPRGTAAQPVAGPSLDQLTAVTAALTALQSSMTTMLAPSTSDQDKHQEVTFAADQADH